MKFKKGDKVVFKYTYIHTIEHQDMSDFWARKYCRAEETYEVGEAAESYIGIFVPRFNTSAVLYVNPNQFELAPETDTTTDSEKTITMNEYVLSKENINYLAKLNEEVGAELRQLFPAAFEKEKGLEKTIPMDIKLSYTSYDEIGISILNSGDDDEISELNERAFYLSEKYEWEVIPHPDEMDNGYILIPTPKNQ